MFANNLRLFLYISIAVATCIVSETSASILPVYFAVALKATLQGMIAWRAYIDETPANARREKEEKKKEKDIESEETQLVEAQSYRE